MEIDNTTDQAAVFDDLVVKTCWNGTQGLMVKLFKKKQGMNELVM